MKIEPPPPPGLRREGSGGVEKAHAIYKSSFAIYESGHYLGTVGQRIDSVKAAFFEHDLNDGGALARAQLSSMPSFMIGRRVDKPI